MFNAVPRDKERKGDRARYIRRTAWLVFYFFWLLILLFKEAQGGKGANFESGTISN